MGCGNSNVAKDFIVDLSNISKKSVKIKCTKYSELVSTIEKFTKIKKSDFTIQNCSSESEF